MTSKATQLEDLDGSASPEQPTPDDQGQPLGETLLQYWRLLRTYYWVVIVTCLVSVAAAYFYTRQQPAVYEARAKIIYHQKSGNIFGKNTAQVDMLGSGGSWKFERFWNTQKEIFESRWFAERVAKRGADEADSPPPLFENETFLPPEEGHSYQQRLGMAVEKILAAVNVSLKQGSRVAVVRAQTGDPRIAQLLANRVADEYTEYTDEFQSRGLENINQFFEKHVAAKRKKLEQAQAKLQRFKQKNDLLSFSYEDRQNLTATNMESVNKKLAEVRDKLSSARTLLNQIETMKSTGHEHRAIADLVENETLKKAFRKEAELEAKLGRLKTRYLEKHPKVRALTEELEIVRDNIDIEIKRVRAALQNRVQLLERRKRDLEAELSRLKQKLLDLDKLGGKYSQLKNRKKNLQELYDTILTRASELDLNSAYDSDDIEVLEEAQKPEAPISPSLPMNLGGGLAVGLLLGLGGIVLIESLDTTIRSEEDIDRYTDKPVLAMLPRLDGSILEGLEGENGSAAD
ncbi:MAG: Wzz/FepE/Etk N-terminal domain-containing protein, partial [Bradymonadaceae bacterium]